MICDIMPTISENGSGYEDRDSQVKTAFNEITVYNCLQISSDGANVEDMLLNMLDERDNLMEKLRKSHEALECTKEQLTELQKEKDILEDQINSSLPQVINYIDDVTRRLT